LAPALRVAVKIAPYFVVVLDCGPATAFALRLISTPRTKSAGTPVWRDFLLQRCLRES